jgi:hypothetical protein
VPGELEPARPLRAGDSDRSAVVDLLRAYHLDGRLPGRLAFVERVELVVEPRLAREQAFEHIAPALARNGYELSVIGGALMFRRAFATLRD